MEEWRDVVGYEGFYMVSSEGRVKSLDRVVAHKGFPRRLHGRYIKPAYTTGYPRISLSKNGVWISKSIHILVAESFIGTRPAGLLVDHIDRNCNNNQVDNLRYVTFSENTRNSDARLFRVKSRFTGVYRHGEGKWLSGITHRRHRIHIGSYNTEIEAARAYDAFCVSHKIERRLNNA